jgi:hypothetical protein
MKSLRYEWTVGEADHVFDVVHVEGTHGRPYSFGEGSDSCQVEVPEFFMATVPVTQALLAGRIWQSQQNLKAIPEGLGRTTAVQVTLR